MTAFMKWSLRVGMSAAFVILGYSTYYFQQQRDEWKSYAEKIMTTPIPFKVDYKTGDVHFKLPWQWGTEEHATMYGLCKDPNDKYGSL